MSAEQTTEERLAQLEQKVEELETRLAEAGRRALFIGKTSDSTDARLDEIGRALLFDTETP